MHPGPGEPEPDRADGDPGRQHRCARATAGPRRPADRRHRRRARPRRPAGQAEVSPATGAGCRRNARSRGSPSTRPAAASGPARRSAPGTTTARSTWRRCRGPRRSACARRTRPTASTSCGNTETLTTRTVPTSYSADGIAASSRFGLASAVGGPDADDHRGQPEPVVEARDQRLGRHRAEQGDPGGRFREADLREGEQHGRARTRGQHPEDDPEHDHERGDGQVPPEPDRPRRARAAGRDHEAGHRDDQPRAATGWSCGSAAAARANAHTHHAPGWVGRRRRPAVGHGWLSSRVPRTRRTSTLPTAERGDQTRRRPARPVPGCRGPRRWLRPRRRPQRWSRCRPQRWSRCRRSGGRGPGSDAFVSAMDDVTDGAGPGRTSRPPWSPVAASGRRFRAGRPAGVTLCRRRRGRRARGGRCRAGTGPGRRRRR